MDTLNFILVLITCSLILYIFLLRKRQNPVRKLITWLNENSIQSAYSSDEAMFDNIIETLKKDVGFKHKAMTQSEKGIDPVKKDNGKKTVQWEDMDIKIQTKEISIEDAKKYYSKYLNARNKAKQNIILDEILNDDTQAILFTLPEIMAALKKEFKPTDPEWSQASFWAGKGFFMYLSNYGVDGDNIGANKWKTSVIFQMAKDVSPDGISGLDHWEVIQSPLYNFGDLKPPKIYIKNENILPI